VINWSKNDWGRPEIGTYTLTVQKTGFSFGISSGTAVVMLTANRRIDFIGSEDLIRVTAEAGELKIQGGREGYINPRYGESAIIVFNPTRSGKVKIDIYTLTGQRIYSTDLDSQEGQQVYSTCDCTNSYKEQIASGIYIVYMHGYGINAKKKICIVR